MANLGNFNANEVEPNTAFDPLPAGKYIACITASEMKSTKNGSGNYLELTFTILEGEHKNRLAWARLCLNHSNAKTVAIARGELSALCRAVGVMTPRDSAELHNIPLQITIRCKKRADTGELTNEVRGYAPKSAAAGVPQQATTNTPPWRR